MNILAFAIASVVATMTQVLAAPTLA